MEKSILIMLDDIWARIDLEQLGIPLDDDHKGCKLLLSSRNQNILHMMETQNNFRLEVLNEKETWRLFEVMAGDGVKEAGLQDIATQVAKKCAGLPVLIVTVARALKNKDIYHWKDALNQLERVDSGEMNGTVYSALEFSYNQLENDEVKTIFLLCGVHGTLISINNLLKYAIGLGILKHVDTMEDARNRLHKMISDLKASCLLLEDETNTSVKMHEIVCDVANSIAFRDKYVFTMKRNANLNDWPSENFLKRCTQIILIRCSIKELPERLECLSLKFLHLNSNDNRFLKFPVSFFEGMVNLELLNLTGMILSLLPTSLASLTKLRTLCLHQCALGDMAAIGALKNLEILSFANSSMEKFPCQISELSYLRMLDLNNSRIKVIPPNIMSKLTKLEELNMNNTSIKWEEESSVMQNENASVAELRHLTNLTALEIRIHEAWNLPRDLMFEKLERYKIVIGDKWKWWDDKYGASRLLMLKLDTNIHLENGIKTLIKRVEDLYLDEINGISNVLYQLNGEGFPLLKHLHIQNNAELQSIIDSKERKQTHVFFPNLEALVLQNLSKLEWICHGPLTDTSFGKLKVIKVNNCSQLQYLFSTSMVKEFSQLFEITISRCSSVKNIVSMESTDGGMIVDEIEFISLRSLTLQDLPRIDDFCSNDPKSSLKTSIPTSFFNAKVCSFPCILVFHDTFVI